MREETTRGPTRIERSRKPENCPACGADAVARIQWGYPSFSPKLNDDLAAGAVVLGGCVMTGDDPRWQCTKCGLKIFPARRA